MMGRPLKGWWTMIWALATLVLGWIPSIQVFVMDQWGLATTATVWAIVTALLRAITTTPVPIRKS